MTGVPAEIGQLKDLEILDLSNNKITGLPNELANLKALKILNLAGNQYLEQDLNIIRRSLPNVQYILK
jgi:Leucine-rich repeat (LRR) protein